MDLRRTRLRAVFGRGRIGDREVLLAKPQTFMNVSGDAARRLVQFYKITQSDFLVAYDDFALDLGVVRLRREGSDAGHNGMRSIIQYLGTPEICRLRLGTGPVPPGMVELAPWVLSPFKPAERETVEDMIARAAEAVEHWLAQGMEAAMNWYNR